MSMSRIRSLVEAVEAPKYDTDVIYKGAALLQNALNYTKDKELADYKIAKEAEKEKQQQENWQKNYELLKTTNDIAKETHDIAMEDHKRKLGTEEMTESLSKVGTALPAEYTDISSLLPKYASVANTAANKAYDKTLVETGNEDAALNAYSKAANDIGKTLFSQQQNELKYNRDAVSQARDILRQNLNMPNGYDSVAVTQNLATLDKPFDAITAKNREDLAANLIGSVRSSKDLPKINDTYLKTTGTTLPASYQLKASDIVRDIEQRNADNKLKVDLARIAHSGGTKEKDPGLTPNLKEFGALSSMKGKKNELIDQTKQLIAERTKYKVGSPEYDHYTKIIIKNTDAVKTLDEQVNTLTQMVVPEDKAGNKKADALENTFITALSKIGNSAEDYSELLGAFRSKDSAGKQALIDALNTTISGHAWWNISDPGKPDVNMDIIRKIK